jgi:hypothetical protein
VRFRCYGENWGGCVTIGYPLPPCPPGGPDPAAVTASIRRWVSSPELAELVTHFGGPVPDGPLDAALAQLADFSAVWDFRAGIRERFDSTGTDYPAEQDARLRTLVDALGLGGPDRPAADGYHHVIVLGGGIRVALGRTDYAARLLAGGLRAGSLTGLGSQRPRHHREHREALRLGLEPVDTEADMMVAGLRRFLGLPRQPATLRTGDGWWLRSWGAVHPGVGEVHVLAAASSRPPRRADTADTLVGWATHVHVPTPPHRVLLVTNHPYVLHQHCAAIRLLGSRYGCGVETVGFDAAAAAAWGRPATTSELLQELRSAVLAMRDLHDSLVPTG